MSADSVNEAITAALGAEGDMPTKWLLLAEVIGPEGDRAIRAVSNPEAMTWDVLGLLHWALLNETSGERS